MENDSHNKLCEAMAVEKRLKAILFHLPTQFAMGEFVSVEWSEVSDQDVWIAKWDRRFEILGQHVNGELFFDQPLPYGIKIRYLSGAYSINDAPVGATVSVERIFVGDVLLGNYPEPRPSKPYYVRFGGSYGSKRKRK